MRRERSFDTLLFESTPYPYFSRTEVLPGGRLSFSLIPEGKVLLLGYFYPDSAQGTPKGVRRRQGGKYRTTLSRGWGHTEEQGIERRGEHAYLRVLPPEALEQVVQRLLAALVLVVHAGDQLRHHAEPAVEVDGGDIDRVVHEDVRHLGDVPVAEPDAQEV